MKTFRFDDVCVNTDLPQFRKTLNVIYKYNHDAHILLAISPIVFSQTQLPIDQQQRVHPRTLTAMSSLTPYFLGQSCGIPDLRAVTEGHDRIILAGHGIAHVDHRLLNRETQELSIMMSCSLARATTFVPPYNKYNQNTIDICKELGFQLVRFEDGWKHVLHNEFDPKHERYYLHPYDMTPEGLEGWFEA